MNVPDAALVLGVIVLIWIAQIGLSYRQAIGLSRRIADMRRQGSVAVGLGHGRWRSRTYAIVAVDRLDRVVGVEVLRGISSLSKPRPFPQLTGMHYEQLCDVRRIADLEPPLRAALSQAVSAIREAREAKATAEGGAAIAQQA